MRKLFRFTGFSMLVMLVLLLLNYKTIKRLLRVNSLFEPENIVTNFQDADQFFPASNIKASSQPLTLPLSLGYEFPVSFTHGDTLIQTSDFITATNTEGLIVIHRDTIIYEKYFLGLEPDERHISWSVSKSFVGTMIGVVVEQGLLDLEDKVTDHLPEFAGTGYAEVTVEQLLRMRSGIGFNEDYSDYNSDINRFGRAFALGTSYRKFAQSLKNEKEPGSVCHYVSIDTQMLGFLLTKVTGRSLTELTQEYLWQPMGMEHEAGWIIDDENFEMALGGLLASLRDYAKLGLLYLHKGQLNGNQVVSSEWIAEASSPYGEGIAHLSPNAYDYGYQWWIPPHADGDFFASGIYDQYIYIHPKKELIVAKLSADPRFKHNGPTIKARHVSLFKKMAEQF